MATKNVSLSPQQIKFVKKSVQGGRYQNASEVVRAGLRLLEQSEREDALKLESLKHLTEKAFNDIDAGKYEEIAVDGLDRFMEKMDAKVRASRKR